VLDSHGSPEGLLEWYLVFLTVSGGFVWITIEDRSAQTAGTTKIRYLHKDH